MFSRSELEANLPASTWNKVKGKLAQIESSKTNARVNRTIARTSQYVENEAAHLKAVTDWYDAQEAAAAVEAEP